MELDAQEVINELILRISNLIYQDTMKDLTIKKLQIEIANLKDLETKEIKLEPKVE